MRLRVGAATLAVSAASALAGVAPVGAVPLHPGPAGSRAPAAQHFRGVPEVGALFVPGAYPSLHTCSASVIRSKSGDVIMTAAHCVSGTGAGYRFAPGYRGGKTPYGVWTVTAAYGDPAWLSGQDPHRDWAFLTVANRTVGGRSRTLQSVTGGHRLAGTAETGSRVTVVGYALGHDDQALRCTTRVYRHAGYPAFDCGGYVGGTSGSPWLQRTRSGYTVVGDIGGLHQGGCTPETSYSPPLGAPAHRALSRAARAQHPDVFPLAGSDGCS